MNSKYLSWLRIWTAGQLTAGAAGWVINAFSLNDNSLGTDERLSATVWQAIFAGMFSWGLVLLAISLAVGAIGDFMSQMSLRKFEEPRSLSNRTEPLRSPLTNQGNGARFSKHAGLSTAEREAWKAAGEPDLSSWDGKSPLSTWLSKGSRPWGD